MAQLFSQLLFIHQQALKDLKRSLRKKITIFITIFISVFILFFISTLNQSLLKEIKSNTKTILGGDAEIELKNKELSSDITKEIKKFADQVGIEFFCSAFYPEAVNFLEILKVKK